MKSYAIRIYETGGPDVLKWESVDVGRPKTGEVLVRHSAIAVNYMDVYYRLGLYAAELPIVLGNEASGVVEEIGSDVTDIRSGDRVAYVTPVVGAYSKARIIAADQLVKIPAGVTDLQAGAGMMKGLTARYLARETYRVGPDSIVLVHAAAGGVGLMLCQIASHLGATVIGTVSSEEKATLAKAHGCTFPVNYRQENFVSRVRKITNGKGVQVAYDSIGRDTFAGSLDCLCPRGLLVVFGHSSGKVPPFDLMTLATKGSLFVTRPTLWTHISTPASLSEAARELFELIERGILTVRVNQTYPLKDAAVAHRQLEARETTGASVLIP